MQINKAKFMYKKAIKVIPNYGNLFDLKFETSSTSTRWESKAFFSPKTIANYFNGH